jgi:hypothetical protein
MAAIVLLCGCAQQSVRLHPTPAQLQLIEPMPVVQRIGQDALQAQDTFTAANISVIPNASTPILVGAAGGALGMLIVDAAIKADARRFAETHVLPIRESLRGFDARGAISQSLQQALRGQPALFGHYILQDATSGAPTGKSPAAVVETRYAMTADFSALQVVATVTVHAAGGQDDKPIYRNVLVYQSPRLSVPPKTAADIARMVTQEDNRYAALHVDGQIEQVNAAPDARDPASARLRQKIVDEQYRHRVLLVQARSPAWGADMLARRLGERWSDNQGEAIKVALQASGPEIVHMLQLDLADPPPADQDGQPRTVFKDGTRTIEYLMGGRMISLASTDTDASLKKPSPPVTMVMPAVGR